MLYKSISTYRYALRATLEGRRLVWMGIYERVLQLTDEEKKEYIELESRETEIENEISEQEDSFSDEQEITVKDLIDSPALKAQYNRFISASNWFRWSILKQANVAWDEPCALSISGFHIFKDIKQRIKAGIEGTFEESL